MLTRRGFLTGTLMAGAAAGTAMLTATPAEVQAFGKPLLGPVRVMQPDPFPAQKDIYPLGDAGEFVFNHKGEIIGVISEMAMECRIVDVTALGGAFQVYRPGMLEVRYTVIGSGYTTVKAGR